MQAFFRNKSYKRLRTIKVWYRPHFDVHHHKKPDQLRVVFDWNGPDWMNYLIVVLTRFLKEDVAITYDIEQIFHSFYVNYERRDDLRFL